MHSYGMILKNSIAILIIFVSALAFTFSFPIDKELKGDILSFLAVIVSAGIALSSTTVLGNLIAGLMNNSITRFKHGDLIKLHSSSHGNIHGRVIKKGIFHTEIQVEDRNVITLPNLFIANNPIKITRKNDSIISTTVSLGYDVSRHKIETSLKEAAIKASLTEPYVYIKELGDFSVVYQIHGLLKDSHKYFSYVSKLNAKVMDELHKNKIEIVSPSFMNQRQVGDTKFIAPHSIKNVIDKEDIVPEDIVFDEAIQSERLEEKKLYLEKLEQKENELHERKKDITNKNQEEKIKHSLEKIKEIKQQLKRSIEQGK